MFIKFLFWPLVLLSLCLAGAASAAPPARQVALVVGNANYALGGLTNPINDARAIAARLREVGFEVDLRTDIRQHEMLRAITDFGQRLQARDIGLVFFAGHGMQIQGRNYLLPVDAQIANERAVLSEAVDVDVILHQFSEVSFGILILDACRNNPFERRFRSATAGGLARMEAPIGMLIAYATAPGGVAMDGSGNNSLYTTALLRALENPGRKVEDIFKQVRVEVVKTSEGQQVPWESSSLMGDYYFAGTDVQSMTANAESLAWEKARTSRDLNIVESVLSQHPSSANAAAGAAASRGLFRDCPICPEMKVVPLGLTHLGSPEREKGRYSDEAPVSERNIEKPFALAVREISVAEFREFSTVTAYRTEAEQNIDAPGCFTWDRGSGEWSWQVGRDWRQPGYPQGERHPAVCISWNDANAYADWLAKLTGKPYRLPTEAEFEHAARAGSASARFWGDSAEDACLYANVEDIASYKEASWREKHDCADHQRFAAATGSYVPNAYGFYDLLGNVGEWSADCWRPGDFGDAKLAAACSGQAVRGGSWSDGPRQVRAAYRGRLARTARTDHVGFRVALPLP
jgi:formylglycine-generating enzyme required for sulfatase activity